jgi:hypothetical protein
LDPVYRVRGDDPVDYFVNDYKQMELPYRVTGLVRKLEGTVLASSALLTSDFFYQPGKPGKSDVNGYNY